MTEPTPVHPAAVPADELFAQCRVDRRRGSGPGGQHRNKTETAIELVHPPTGVSASAGERRSQRENQRRALFRLRLNLALQVRRARSAGEAPSELWQRRRQGRTLPVNARHDEFPALLAEALDTIADRRLEVSAAARALGVSTSQLIKLLKKHPPAFQQLNEQRAARGLHKLQ